MRYPALSIVAVVTIWAAGPVQAQTYSPDYPVCLHVYHIDGDYFECAYSTLAQCAMSASGRAAQCVVNPYFARPQAPAGPYYRGHRRVN